MFQQRIFILILILILASAGTSHAQTSVSIHGIVTNEAKKAVDDGIASLYRLPDSGFVALAPVSNGTFDFKQIAQGKYLIKVACAGCVDHFTNITLATDRPLTIEMERKMTGLKEVQVTGYKNMFSYKNGNIVATVENTTLATMPEAIEILARLPTVQVSGDRENVSIVGKGEPLIYLDNQRITLNELNALSVNDIKTIEIINHPSAKYEADGRAVILVTRRKSSKEGSRIDLAETAAKKRYFENRSAINGSIKSGKIEWKANVQHNFATRFEGLDGILSSTANNYDGRFNGTSIGPRHQYLFGGGMYMQLNETDYFSVNANGRIQTETAVVNTNSYIIQNNVETTAMTKIKDFVSRPFGNASLNYQKSLKKIKGELFTGFQYSQYSINKIASIMNNFNNTSLLESERRLQNFLVDVGVARIDFRKTLSNNINWETGGNINTSLSNSVFSIDYVPANGFSSRYKYNENNQALYTQFSGREKKIDWLAGLRLENTIITGRLNDSSKLLVDRKFLYLFPRAKFSYQIDTQKQINVNYARNISRPSYSNANQVSNYITPFLERANNINIMPNITDEVSVNYQFRDYTLEATAYQTANPSWYVTQDDTALNKVTMINTNLEKMLGATLSLTVPVSYKWYVGNNVLFAQVQQIKDNRAKQNAIKPIYYLYSNNQFKLPQRFTFTLTGWINTKQQIGIFERQQQFAVDLSLSKVFLKKFTCTVNAFDIFRSLNYVESYQINGIYSSTTYLENQKEFSINLKYSFGAIKEARFKNREVNENSNRLN